MKKVVLITGASRGIGKSCAIKFAKEGYSVVINYIENEKCAKEVLEEVNKYSSDNMVIKADVSKEEQIVNMFKVIYDKYQRIDVLINNAAIAIDSLVEDKNQESFNKILNTNLIGPFICSREYKKYMNYGNIIMITSTDAIDTYYPYGLDYDASKAGLISLTHNLAVEYGPNIRVNAIAAGWVNTDMNRELDKEMIEEKCRNIILGRFANPDEIASVVHFLTTDEAKYINNEIIRVDGGFKC